MIEDHRKTQDLVGRAGFWASSVCAIHCAITPLVAGLLPILGLGFLANNSVEWIFIGGSLVLGIYSLGNNYLRLHHDLRPLMLFVLGGVLLMLANWLFAEDAVGISVSVTGAIFMSGAHLVNRRVLSHQLCNSHAPESLHTAHSLGEIKSEL
jgi:MerC mercury resistance protein